MLVIAGDPEQGEGRFAPSIERKKVNNLPDAQPRIEGCRYVFTLRPQTTSRIFTVQR